MTTGWWRAKTGAVIRKHMGYEHIQSSHAEVMEAFYEQYFNPYLNYHRPCGVPEVVTNAKGKQRRVYRWYATPWEILRQLPDLARHLKPGLTQAALEQLAGKESDTAAALRMQAAKVKLFAGIGLQRTA